MTEQATLALPIGERVQHAYQWAFTAKQNPKSGVMLLYCATMVQSAVDDYEKYDDAAEAIVVRLAEWKRKAAESKRLGGHVNDGLSRAITIVSAIMGVS